mmetsp:Transcript_96785/g.250476  ORF Transcript_96785/g.250476 Transcript_96785/m.250476 type:complete len:90 (-) Transcript_96785:6-275(-)
MCTVFKAREGCFASDSSDFEPLWNDVLLGVTFGFCGALSTMSTLASQLFEMDMLYAFVYCNLSLLAAQVILCVILGVFLHTSGVTTVCV